MIRTGVTLTLISTLFACVDAGSEPQDTEVVVERTASGQPFHLAGGDLGLLTPEQLIPNADLTVPAIRAQVNLMSTSELRVRKVEHDQLGMTHVRVSHRKNGLRVVSGEAILHLDSSNVIQSVDSGLVDRDLAASPTLDATRATEIAVQASPGAATTEAAELVYVVSNRDGELYLAWEIRVNGSADGVPMSDLVYVDALGDRVVDRHPRIFTAKNRTIRTGNNGAFPVANAAIVGTEAQPPTEAIALAAFTNTGITHDCYKALYNRDSYDGAGAALNSQVHVRFDFGGAQLDPNNAIWAADLLTMAYGDGDGTLMSPLARSLDVTAHELTHAVTSASADLIYQNESGALNESMSDIFGIICESFSKGGTVDASTFLLGDDIYTPNTPGDALRYMDNPTKDGYSPDNYAERLQIAEDNGGVHGNSGISNLAFKLLVTGGKHPRNKTTIEVPAIGIEVAGQIFHRALTTKMTPNTNFAQARTAIEQSAQDLYPGTCAKPAISLAFAAVGVGQAPAPDTTAPTVAITSPANGANVAAGFEVVATATDDQCVNKVELLVDGQLVETLTAAPYTFTTANLTNGSHELVVKSYDTANQGTSSSVRVNLGGAGGGNGGGDGNGDLTGGCSTSGGQGSLALVLLGLGLVVNRRRGRGAGRRGR